MILNLRGPSGAGKSYPGFELLKEYGPPIEEIRTTEYFPNRKTGEPRKKPKLVGQVLPGDLVLAGRYTMGASTRLGKDESGKAKKGYSGGVDGFYPMDELTRMLDDLAEAHDHVYFESLLISGTFQRWLDFSERWKHKHEVVFATLDTPFELSIERILKRNGGKPIREDDVAKHRRQVHRCAKKFHEAGATSYMVDHTQSYEQVRGLLLQGGWDPVGSPREEVQEGHSSA